MNGVSIIPLDDGLYNVTQKCSHCQKDIISIVDKETKELIEDIELNFCCDLCTIEYYRNQYYRLISAISNENIKRSEIISKLSENPQSHFIN